MQKVEWCRDVDWGTAPQWATVAVAVIVGGFSIWGIITARGSYKKSVKDTHEAQARLVYGELLNVRFVPKGTSITELPGGSVYGMRILDDNENPIMNIEQKRAYFTLGVVNRSQELIGEVTVGVFDHNTGKSHELARAFFDVINPEDDDSYVVAVPDEWSGSYSLAPQVTFTDSGGATWTRVGSKPVTEIRVPSWWQFRKKRAIKQAAKA